MSRVDVADSKTSAYSQTGSALTTSYTYGANFSVSQGNRLTLFASTTTAGSGSTYTSVNFKCQISWDGTNWVDIQLVDSAAGTTSNVASITAPSAGNTTYKAFQTTGHNPSPAGIRVGVQMVGAAGATGDTVTVNAAWQ